MPERGSASYRRDCYRARENMEAGRKPDIGSRPYREAVHAEERNNSRRLGNPGPSPKPPAKINIGTAPNAEYVRGSGYYSAATHGFKRKRAFPNKNYQGRSAKLVKQVIICLIIFLLAVGLKDASFPFSDNLKSGIRYLLTTETDFSPVFEKVVAIAGQWNNIDWPLPEKGGKRAARPVISKVTEGIGPEMPLGGQVLKPYGWTIDEDTQIFEFHSGLDLGAEEGENVQTVAAGSVIKVFSDEAKKGSVIVRHDDKWMTLYTNLYNISVHEGEEVDKGQKIGEVEEAQGGQTHLHFEVLLYGRPIDPLTVITGI